MKIILYQAIIAIFTAIISTATGLTIASALEHFNANFQVGLAIEIVVILLTVLGINLILLIIQTIAEITYINNSNCIAQKRIVEVIKVLELFAGTKVKLP